MALVAGAAGVAAAAYLNGRFQLAKDFETLYKAKRGERYLANNVKNDRVSSWHMVEEACKQNPHIRAIWTRERSWTFQEMYDNMLQLAAWLYEEGVRPGDLVSIYLLNCPEFVMLFFAAHAIGASTSLINYNLEGHALLHCLSQVRTKILIADTDPGCQRRISESLDKIKALGTKVVNLDEQFKRDIRLRPVVEPDKELIRGTKPTFPYVVLFTSGTTGMPKGNPFQVARVHIFSPRLEGPFNNQPGKDCWYCPMPLYHGTGLIVTTLSLLSGVGVAIAPKFSVSNFWPDIYNSGSTMFMYVGETARYLLAGPPHPLERAHNLRLIYGNGLRPDVWQKFQERFNIPEVGEFFNSSEGVFGLLVYARNDYLRGCVGHHGLLYRKLLNNVFVPVRIDHETGDIWRDPKTGFAERMPYDVGGEMVVKIPSRAAFGGYWNNPEATEKKFATNVFEKDDLYYRSGDALRRDSDGKWFFLDRLGDTYRWKSENVSTAEVAEALGRYPGIAEANVYGVRVPGHEGRAGCAAIDVKGTGAIDYADLLKYTRKQLPGYAVPVFLRIVKNSSHIHNHKQNKVGLRKEGIDLNKIGTEEKNGAEDTILWCKPKTDSYVPFEMKDWQQLQNGEVKL